MKSKAVKAAKDLDLESLLTKKVGKVTENEHPLRGFFLSRGITQRKLALYLDTFEPYVSQYLRGIRFIPAPVETKLFELHDKIVAWEAKNGRKFC